MESRSTAGLGDPALDANSGSTQAQIESLVFENLVTFDDSGAMQPKLATGWQHSADYKRWEIEIRGDVKFQNGQPLTSALVAESLKRSRVIANARVSAESGHVVVESDVAMTDLLAELAKPENAIAARSTTGELSGTGPFKPAARQQGQVISLVANDDYWGGRPYLDGVEITLGRSERDQMIDMELGKADVIELDVDQVRQAQQMGTRAVSSEPSELLALVFNPASISARDERVRRTLALTIDRNSICNVLLQRQAEPSAALLPQWMTGYAFLFPSGRDVERAREQQLKSASLVLDYDFSDAAAKAIAERIAVNAREAGIVVQAVGENLATRTGSGDATITRIRLGSVDAKTALENAAATLSIQAPEELQRAHGPEQLYGAEQAMLANHRIIPIAHVPETYGLSARVKDWAGTLDSGWRLEEVWLAGTGATTVSSEGRQ